MIISIIVAMDELGVIGVNNSLPWRLSADLKNVKQVTMGKPIIMGRKTHESIGKPLPGRENIVITRDNAYRSDGCTVFNSVAEALAHCADKEELMIMGGAELYRQTLAKADRIYLTKVHTKIEGDAFFPELNLDEWKEISRESFDKDDKNEFDYSLIVLERIC